MCFRRNCLTGEAPFDKGLSLRIHLRKPNAGSQEVLGLGNAHVTFVRNVQSLANKGLRQDHSFSPKEYAHSDGQFLPD